MSASKPTKPTSKKPAGKSSKKPALPKSPPAPQPEPTGYEKLLALAADRVKQVGMGYSHALYLYGVPGTGKTTLVDTVLKGMGVSVKDFKGRLSAPALIDYLSENPDHYLILDDIEAILKDHATRSLIMSATDGTKGQVRTLTYKTAHRDYEVPYTGGIVMLSNKELADPALASRFTTIPFNPSDGDIAEQARKVAVQGFETHGGKVSLTPKEAGEVCEYVIGTLRRLGMRHSFRAFEKGYSTYAYCRKEVTSVGWEQHLEAELVAMKSENVQLRIGRADRLDEERRILSECFEELPYRDQLHQRYALWVERCRAALPGWDGESDKRYQKRWGELKLKALNRPKGTDRAGETKAA